MPGHATRVFVIRHGQTAWNVLGRIQGHLDFGLDATGREQARRLADAGIDTGLDAIYASDLARALQTARPLADRAGVAITLDAGLRERAFGVFEGLTHDEVAQRWPELARRWRARDPAFAPDGGEALADFSTRCVGCATRLAALHPGQTIALFAHGGVLDCLYRAATRLALQAPRTWQLGNASINRLLYGGEGFALVGWDDRMHLAAAASVGG